MATVWPRAAAVGEVLWTAEKRMQKNDMDAVEDRLVCMYKN